MQRRNRTQVFGDNGSRSWTEARKGRQEYKYIINAEIFECIAVAERKYLETTEAGHDGSTQRVAEKCKCRFHRNGHKGRKEILNTTQRFLNASQGPNAGIWREWKKVRTEARKGPQEYKYIINAEIFECIAVAERR